MKRMIICLAFFLAALTATAAAMQHQQIQLSEKMVRLHVVANSDSSEDQALKLQVRDAVLSVTQALSGKDDIQTVLPQIKAAAEVCLRQNGSLDNVCVSLGKEHFPTRVYENFSLPAGVYTALRVTIGAGEGKNWWCVVFPSICFRATTEDLEEAAVTAGFTRDEVALITEENNGYVLKFKTLELLDELKSKLFP